MPCMDVQGIDQAEKDAQSVTPAGLPVAHRIEGVEFRPAATHADERGSLTEIFRADWSSPAAPVEHVYEVVVRPGAFRGAGWTVHLDQDDRLFFSNGAAKVAMYDARRGSATEGVVDVRFLGAHARGILVIPAGVYHTVKNVGATELTFVNLPTRPYDHANPDKFRLPFDNDLIPYRP